MLWPCCLGQAGAAEVVPPHKKKGAWAQGCWLGPRFTEGVHARLILERMGPGNLAIGRVEPGLGCPVPPALGRVPVGLILGTLPDSLSGPR